MHDIFELISKSIFLVGCDCRLLECVSIGVYLTEISLFLSGTSVCLTGTSVCFTGTSFCLTETKVCLTGARVGPTGAMVCLTETRVCLTGSKTAVLRYNIFCLFRTNSSQSVALNCNKQVRITVTSLKNEKCERQQNKRQREDFFSPWGVCLYN